MHWVPGCGAYFLPLPDAEALSIGSHETRCCLTECIPWFFFCFAWLCRAAGPCYRLFIAVEVVEDLAGSSHYMELPPQVAWTTGRYLGVDCSWLMLLILSSCLRGCSCWNGYDVVRLGDAKDKRSESCCRDSGWLQLRLKCFRGCCHDDAEALYEISAPIPVHRCCVDAQGAVLMLC
ncbi:hypothetical protein Nepgr_008048 [Nepenthes gracilis]|uniref:Uncharacterized protein n=1 Tax=Nepenthes gracilis TaxID=150966 RepID=A0AAD3XIV9_NEPGR|nr:hypothetical protein Nepgr_008048 [Nepenthes gracilis]